MECCNICQLILLILWNLKHILVPQNYLEKFRVTNESHFLRVLSIPGFQKGSGNLVDGEGTGLYVNSEFCSSLQGHRLWTTYLSTAFPNSLSWSLSNVIKASLISQDAEQIMIHLHSILHSLIKWIYSSKNPLSSRVSGYFSMCWALIICVGIARLIGKYASCILPTDLCIRTPGSGTWWFFHASQFDNYWQKRDRWLKFT